MLDLTKIDEAVRYEGGVTRRLLLAYGAALAAIPTLGLRADAGQKGGQKAAEKGAAKIDRNPFTLGVASGDPQHDSVVIWTRLAPHPLQDDGDGGMPHHPVDVRWEFADDEGFKKIVHQKTAQAAARLGHSVHVVVEGLKPDRWYYYRFHVGNYTSPVGRTRTMPAHGDMPSRLRFAFASCQNYEAGLYTAYKHMAGDDLDLVLHLGDYIYEFAPRPKLVRKHAGDGRCRSLADYRVRYNQYKADPLLHGMHARCPWVVTWDDHEVEGNYANDISKTPGVPPAEFLKHRAHAYHAYYEMMPLRPHSQANGHNLKLHRQVTFGQLASFKVLDTRQYRADQPNGDGHKPLNAAAFSKDNTIMGKEQREWLEDALGKSKARWNVIAQQVMMGMVDRHGDGNYSMDAWTGYMHERTKLMEFLHGRKVSNPVVLSGDVHTNWVNDLRVDDRKAELPVVATEFIGTSISTGGNGHGSGHRVEKLAAVNPCVKYYNHYRGYVRCTVTPKEWRTDFQTVTEVEKPGGAATTAATFVVQNGRAGVVKG